MKISTSPQAAADASIEANNATSNEGRTPHLLNPSSPTQQFQTNSLPSSEIDTDTRLDTLARERNALREEVAQLRRSLEEIQEKHEEDMMSHREQLESTRGEKEHAETQYRNLLGKVNTIRSQLGDRLKADAVCSRLLSCD